MGIRGRIEKYIWKIIFEFFFIFDKNYKFVDVRSLMVFKYKYMNKIILRDITIIFFKIIDKKW